MWKKILLALVVLVALAAGVIALQPAEYRVERSARMAAPPSAVFAQVNDFHNWDAWSPWAQLDPDAKSTFEGPAAGTGAMMSWDGNDQVGQGRMTILDSRPGELDRIKLEFSRPMQNSCTTEFTLQPDGDQTLVTWSMFGQRDFTEKALCLVMDMDTMVGGAFEKGLASIKSIVESKK
jgi:hypothetical protein